MVAWEKKKNIKEEGKTEAKLANSTKWQVSK